MLSTRKRLCVPTMSTLSASTNGISLSSLYERTGGHLSSITSMLYANSATNNSSSNFCTLPQENLPYSGKQCAMRYSDDSGRSDSSSPLEGDGETPLFLVDKSTPTNDVIESGKLGSRNKSVIVSPSKCFICELALLIYCTRKCLNVV